MRKHGTHSCYGSGCRCEPCRQAESEYKRAWLKKAAEIDSLPGSLIECPRCGRMVAGPHNLTQHLKGHRAKDRAFDPQGPTELVTADALAKGDHLASSIGAIRLLHVLRGEKRVYLISKGHEGSRGKTWFCRPSTRFMRYKRKSARIEMGRKSERDA